MKNEEYMNLPLLVEILNKINYQNISRVKFYSMLIVKFSCLLQKRNGQLKWPFSNRSMVVSLIFEFVNTRSMTMKVDGEDGGRR